MEFNHPVGDYHVHPDFSIDAEGTLREYCEKAIELGLAEIVFTTHVDSNPASEDWNKIIINGQKEPITTDNLKIYQDAVNELIHGDDPVPIAVRCGVELEYHPEVKDSFLQMVADLNFDFVLGAVHFVDDGLLTVEEDVQRLLSKYSPVELIEKYYKIVQQACEIKIFDSLAHLDIYRRIGHKLFPEEAARIDYEFLDETLEQLVKFGLPIEVNTSGIRHGIGDWYPSKPLLHKARQANVLIGGLGSDAHAPDQLAVDFEMAHLIVHETFPKMHED
ncbi:MAG: histidinol-phosphatase HisJ family protein [candidate division Zixibacteria bacterium]|nr:histidinol-phosphatase HisJ family protein [candidate division Zixibacteria bacterium]NIR66126.1 histidinol-phosphatase HisJ family protein [candidate division Zixibacteria bacterium]NIS15857.1 histidinol-phosphatase HisJ family protein [candidate division Zixibacteria bacterium]NIS47747.1 histidinol-phosphatase HisJ family protein [candidate division Zixibacteria bacterium]NIT54482.1 histidinol-phosphatase HisJ family protein [candidate division Zixibacteria bacterium]